MTRFFATTLAVLLAVAALISPSHAVVRISEFMADNANTLADVDGAFSDWIEIENTDAGAVNLDGWFLTDDSLVLNKWRIPAVSLAAGGRLLVFASLKDRANPAEELHTNFSLEKNGGYLALVMPDGVTKATEFAPYSEQREDVSFGTARIVTEETAVFPTKAARFLVPTAGNPGAADWRVAGFSDAAWTAANAAVGYHVVSGPAPGEPLAYWSFDGMAVDGSGHGHDATIVGAAFSATVPPPVGAGQSLAMNTADQDHVVVTLDVSETAYTSAFWFRTTSPNTGLMAVTSGALGAGGHDRHLVLTAGNMYVRTWNNEALATTGKNYADGQWHHVAHVFGGAVGGQKVFVDGVQVIAGAKANSDFNWQTDVYFGYSPDSSQQFFTGDLDEVAVWSEALNTTQIAALASGVSPLALAGYAPYIKTNVQAAMQTVNSSAYLRVPFTLPAAAASYEALFLKMRHDDGFVAYLNGTEIARRNAPAWLPYNATATADRTLTQGVTQETIDITPQIGALTAGTNVLAIHALNDSAASGEFLCEPYLVAQDIAEEAGLFFTSATPGQANGPGVIDFVADTTFTVGRGWFTAPFSTTVATATPGATLAYTTDGSVPSATNGTQVAQSSVTLNLSTTTTLRAVALKPGWQPSDTDTQTYIFRNSVRNQPALPPGYPATWSGGIAADYAVDPNVVNTTLAGYSFEDAITSLPTLSIVAPHDSLWGTSGVYFNTQQRGLASEKRVSVEFFEPDPAGKKWHIDAGLRSHGNSSRDHGFTPKHPFRLYFRREYGDGKLKEKVFSDSPVDSFDRLNLRGSSTDSWPVVDGPPRWVNEKGTYMRDLYMRDTMRAAGNAAGHGRYVQLFFNGLYWGLYEITERPEESFCENYLGGAKDDYDVIKDFAELHSGNYTAWNQLMALANGSELTADAGYWKVQGKNPDGTPNAAFPVLLHIPSFIDYMILHIAGGAEDWPAHNYWCARSRLASSDGFHFFPWDQEISNDDLTRTRSVIFPEYPFEAVAHANCPAIIYSKLRLGAAFKQRFRDRVHELYFNNGPLAPANARARWGARQAQLDKAMVGESARWGDRQQLPAFKRETTWLAEMNFMQAAGTGFWDAMFPVHLQRFRNVALYPSFDGPAFSQQGGTVAPGYSLSFSAPNGVIFYTSDGSDPRAADGSPAPSAIGFNGSIQTVDIIAANATWKYFTGSAAPANDGAGANWKTLAYADGAWASGPAQLGYGDGDEATVVPYGSNPNLRYMTTYFRKTFSVANPALLSAITLHLLRDDGAIVYLNGTEIVRSNYNAGSIIHHNIAATSAVNAPEENTFYTFPLTAGQLLTGTNVLAVEIHKSSFSEDDLGFAARISAQTVAGGSNPYTVTQNTTVNARVFHNGEWSGMNIGSFLVNTVPAGAGNLVVSELHYHPADAVRPAEVAISADQDDYEFIELMNSGAQTIDLAGVEFSGGVTFAFPTNTVVALAPGARVVVVRNAAAFAARYGAGVPVAGVFTNSTNLSNGGEQVTLRDRNGAIIREFTYDDAAPWPAAADGGAFSLVLVNPASNPDHALAGSWSASFDPGGSPGIDAAAFGYAHWRTRWFDPASGSYAADSAMLADIDGDGWTNLHEFGLATNPLRADRADLASSIVNVSGQDFLAITYRARPAAAGLSYVVEFSTDLAAWQSGGAFTQPVDAVAHADGTTSVTVRAAIPVGSGRQFLRVKVIGE